MTLISSIIQQALRETNLIALGASPTAAETAESLIKLQSLVSSALGNEVGENLAPWPLGNYGRTTESQMWISEQMLRFPMINSALVAVNEAAFTAYLPVNPSDGARVQILDPYARLATYPVTLDGNGRTVETAATQLLDDSAMTGRTWLYRADRGDWVRVTDLEEDGDMPFPREFDDYFVISLAMRINPAYSVKLDEQSLARLKQQQRQLTARYVQSAPLSINADISFQTLQGYNNFSDAWAGGTTQEFNQGSPAGWWV